MTFTTRYLAIIPIVWALAAPAGAAEPVPGDKEVKQTETRAILKPTAAVVPVSDDRTPKARRDSQLVPVFRPDDRGRPTGRVGGGSRGGAEEATPVVLAPSTEVRTVSAAPVLFWHIDRAPSAGTIVVFTLIDDEEIAPLVEAELEAPGSAGIQRIRLSDHGVALEVGHAYTWSVSLVIDPNHRSRDIVASGFIDRVSSPHDLDPADASPRALWQRGFWYDALASVSAEIEAAPADPRLRSMRAMLLYEVGLERLAPAALFVGDSE